MGLATFELFTWDFPAEYLSMLSAGGKIAVWLTRCVWNSLPRAFHWSLHLLAFSAWCQASVDLACVSYEPLLFGWVLCFREGYSSQVTSFAAQCVVVRRESVSFMVASEDRI